MRLENHRPGTNHFSPLASGVARRAYLIKTPMGSRQGVRLGQRPLAGRLSGSIRIDHYPLAACSIKQTAGRREWLASKHILVKACA